MEINDYSQDNFLDLFGGKAGEAKPSGFAATGVDKEISILSTTETTTLAASTTDTTTTVASSTTDTTTASASTTDTTTEVDIFAVGADDKKKEPVKYDFSDISGYYQDRIKSGKFVQIKEDTADGKTVDFIPKTPEEYDEVFELQINHRLEKEKTNLVKQIYQSKTPAWQAVLKYSELVDDPSEVLPFIQGVKNVESVAQADETTPEGAERIVRARLQQRGETPELIEQQVETLKGADKLLSTAKVYKPLIIQEEQTSLTQLMQERQAEQQQYMQMVEEIEQKALVAIEAPIFGKQKLTKDEKAVVYDMIAFPSEETKGYNIFSKIDGLFSSGKPEDFETLKLVSLLVGGKKDAVIKYIASGAANATAASLQKTLRVAATTNSSSNTDADEPITVKRTQFSGRFGR
jgi:uncharacterized protein Yka (UPF0111/DUF47 family)